MGVLADKEYEKIVGIMAPYAGKVFTITPHNLRAFEADKLAEVFVKAGCHSVKVTDVPQAVNEAKRWCKAGQNRGILAFGSFTFLKEFKEQINGKNDSCQ